MGKGQFSLPISEFAARAGVRADEAVRQVVLTIHRRLVERSPVLTGRFRSNWTISDITDGIPVSIAEAATIYQHGPVPPPPMGPRAAGRKWRIGNNLPYAMALEMGHSKQAPAGMVGLTAIEFQPIVDAASRKAAA